MFSKDGMTNYKKHKALAEYIDRTGAIQVNHRRFIIREYHGHYSMDKVIITISDSGDITCSDDRFDPTTDEAKAIKDESADYQWPKPVPTSVPGMRDGAEKLIKASKMKWVPDNLYLFPQAHDRGTVIMAQYRFDKKDGSKAYYPISQLDDGSYVFQEPEGRLPFWKPLSNRGLAKIMVHEGGKAAKAMDDLVNGVGYDWDEKRRQHPWANTLSSYEHWGIIGGALSPHRADIDELRKISLMEVVYCCDNDTAGLSVLQPFSRAYRRRLIGFKPHGHFPDGWDMADEIPQIVLDDRASMMAFGKPATWATEVLPGEGPRGGRPVFILLKDFKQEWRCIVEPELYVHKDRPDRPLTRNIFNNLVRPFSDTEDTGRLVLRDESLQCRQLQYNPGKPPGVFMDQGFECLNTHLPTNILPVKGDPKRFLDFINTLIPIPADQHNVKRWCATLIAAPEEHINFGLLMISERQGVGKTTLGFKILAPLVGMSNVSLPSETEILTDQFNSWVAHKRLAVIEEIYSGDSNTMYNKLKPYFTNDEITVSRKYVERYKVSNFIHIFASSNSLNAIKLQETDRRWLVPEVSENLRPYEYWEDFNGWLSKGDGLGIIRWWAIDFLKTNQRFCTGQHPPDNAYKRDIIHENLSRGQQLVKSLIMNLQASNGAEPWLTSDEVMVEVVKDTLYDGRHNERLERPLTLAKAIRGMDGVWVSKRRILYQGIYGRLITNTKHLSDLNSIELRKAEFKFLKAADFHKFGG